MNFMSWCGLCGNMRNIEDKFMSWCRLVYRPFWSMPAHNFGKNFPHTIIHWCCHKHAMLTYTYDVLSYVNVYIIIWCWHIYMILHMLLILIYAYELTHDIDIGILQHIHIWNPQPGSRRRCRRPPLDDRATLKIMHDAWFLR